MTQSEPCPSCDRDLSYPGAPGHECYTYAERHRWIELRKRCARCGMEDHTIEECKAWGGSRG